MMFLNTSVAFSNKSLVLFQACSSLKILRQHDWKVKDTRVSLSSAVASMIFALTTFGEKKGVRS